MNIISKSAPAAIIAIFLGAIVAGCSHTAQPTATSPGVQTASNSQLPTIVQPFNPTVVPPSATPADTPAYTFSPSPAPLPEQTSVVSKHLHRYLHVVYRSKHCYLADNFGHYYSTGRTSSGNLYPVYQDPVTQAVYPLYYDQQRDNYYRCVDNALAQDNDNNNGAPDDEDSSDPPAGYYRNYIGDNEDQFYAADDDQPEECQSDDCQPFIVNYYSDDCGYDYYRYHHREGFDPSYGYYAGPVYHPDDVIYAVPVIVAAYILFEPHHDSGDYHPGYGYGYSGHRWNHEGGNYSQNTVIVNNHYYYQRNVVINNYNNHSSIQVAALPGPPLGRFSGYRQDEAFSHSTNGMNIAYGNRPHILPPVTLPGQQRQIFSKSGYGHLAPTENVAGAPPIGPPHQTGAFGPGPATTLVHPQYRSPYSSVYGHEAVSFARDNSATQHRIIDYSHVDNLAGAGAPNRSRTYSVYSNYDARTTQEQVHRVAENRGTSLYTHVAARNFQRMSESNNVGMPLHPELIDRTTPGGRTAYTMRPSSGAGVYRAYPQEKQNQLLRQSTMAPVAQRYQDNQFSGRLTPQLSSERTYTQHQPVVRVEQPTLPAKQEYRAPRPIYQTPQYEAPRPQYQAPLPQYQTPRPAYQAPQHQTPRQQYQEPQPQYHPPMPIYQAPQYQAPRQQYQAPSNPQSTAPRPEFQRPPSNVIRRKTDDHNNS